MMLYNISKVDRLFETLDSCKGDVTVVTPNGNAMDWKESRELFESVWSTTSGQQIDQIEIRLNNAEDTVNMVDFLIRGNCA